MTDKIPIQTETIVKMRQSDVDLITDVYYSLSDFIENNRDFYITVFKNQKNRKIILKVSGGLLRQAQIEKNRYKGVIKK